MATLKIKTGLTRLRFGLTSWRGGCLDYYLDGGHVGHQNVAVYQPVRMEVAPGEHVLEVRQEAAGWARAYGPAAVQGQCRWAEPTSGAGSPGEQAMGVLE